MELVFGIIIGVAAMALCVRRAIKKPDGKTAKLVGALSGPGPWRPPQ